LLVPPDAASARIAIDYEVCASLGYHLLYFMPSSLCIELPWIVIPSEWVLSARRSLLVAQGSTASDVASLFASYIQLLINTQNIFEVPTGFSNLQTGQ
jgi:hypothetical protein